MVPWVEVNRDLRLLGNNHYIFICFVTVSYAVYGVILLPLFLNNGLGAIFQKFEFGLCRN